MKRIQVGTIMCVAALAMALGACGSWSPNDPPEEELCNEVAELDAALTTLASLPDNAPASAVQQARGRLDQEYQEVVEKAGETNIGIDGVTTAYNNAVRAVGTATSQGVGAAKEQFDQAAAQLNQARTQINQTAGC